MLIDTYTMLVHAQAETVWKLLMDRIDNPQNYLHGVNGVRIIERSTVGVIREIDWEGKYIREKILADKDDYRITTHLMEHPLYTGVIENRIVQSAVQNPMAPVYIETSVKLERRSLHLEGLVRTEAELVADLEKELLAVKHKAEELEREENRPGEGARGVSP